jgi:putative phosphoribosyl transferase
MGAITGRVRIRDDRMIRQLGISNEEVEEIIAREQAELMRREDLFRGGKPALGLRGQSRGYFCCRAV